MSSILKWASTDGSFQRPASQFRNWISKTGPFPPEKNRYVLYVSLACPWAHRTLIVRKLKGLEECIRLSVVDFLMGEDGWKFSSPSETPGCIPDPLYNAKCLKDIYFKSDPQYNGRFTVPVLFDSKTEKIVSNESADIIRMLNSEFNEFASDPKLDLYPEPLRGEIDEINGWIYDELNNGVYRSGFATTQEKYEDAAKIVHSALCKVNELLERKKYLIGEQLTEADIRLFTTMIRFDPVYFGHFKCNLLAVKDCKGVLEWLKKLYPSFKETVNMVHIKNHYYMSHKQINPTGIVPLSNGPKLD